MSTVICQGCGQAFAVPAGYARNKIQCPGCGVICAVPAGGGGDAPRAAPSRASDDDAAAWLRDPEPPPPPRRRDEPPPPVAVDEPIVLRMIDEPEVRRPSVVTVPCRRCGRPILRQRECPACDVVGSDEPLPEVPTSAPEPTFPRAAASASTPAPALSMELDPPDFVPREQDDEEDDPDPYDMRDKEKPRCPKCRKDMDFGTVLCAGCGFNVRTRKKAKRRYSLVARQWETDMPLTTRFAWLGGFWAVHLLVTFVVAMRGDLASAIVSWFPLTLIVAFIVGTYDNVQIFRDERGRVTLVKRWRFFFIPAAPQTIEVSGYEGVKIGGWNDSGVMEWVICLSLLCLGCLPALIWWYVAIYQNHYHVSLAEDHGRPALTVYRGRSEAQMHEIAGVLGEAAGLQVSA